MRTGKGSAVKVTADLIRYALKQEPGVETG